MPELNLSELRSEIDKNMSGIPEGAWFQVGELRENLEILGFKVTCQQLKKLRDCKFINPTQDSRGYYLYSREDLGELLLIQTLREKHKVQLAEIGGLFLSELRHKVKENGSDVLSSEGLPPDQIDRTNLFWRSYLMMVVLAFLFEEEIPRNTRILIRKKLSPTAAIKKSGSWVTVDKCDFFDLEQELFESRSELEYCLMSVDNREILHMTLDLEDWKECQNRSCDWFAIRGFAAESDAEYQLILGMLDDSHVSWNSLEHGGVNAQSEMVLLKLLECFFLESQNRDLSSVQFSSLSARLQVLVRLIPDLSAAWQFCVVLVPNDSDGGELSIAAASEGISLSEDLQVPMYKILGGWVYDSNQFVIVNRTIEGTEPRIFYQSGEKTGATGAFPTQTKNADPNGVLFVGLRDVIDEEKQNFSAVDIKLLRILSGIIGELVELRDMRVRVEETGRQIVLEKNFIAYPWETYKQDVKAAVLNLMEVPAAERHNSLHIVTFSLHNYDQIKQQSAEVADWIVCYMQMSAYHYYLKEGFGEPRVYRYKDDKFVLFLDRFTPGDEGERKLREELTDLLNSIRFFFELQGNEVSPKCEFWSMPFRYDGILQKIDDEEIGENDVVNELVSKTEYQFKIFHYVWHAHEYEAEASWQRAISEYEEAFTHDHSNTFLRRHIAKMNTELRNYDEAIRLWHQILLVDIHPSYYRRLAYNYACLGELEAAEDLCKRALNIDPEDARSHVMLGNVYRYHGNIEGAVKSYRQAISYDPERQVDYLHQIVETYYEAGQCLEALTVCTEARARDHDNFELRYWIPKIEQKLRT